MSQDIVSDGLNQIMNAKKAGKEKVTLSIHSKVLLSVLAIGKLRSYIKNYEIVGKELSVEIGEKFNACKAIKPRYLVKSKELAKYVKRYLPARDMGILIISTNKGLVTHQTAIEQGIGGSIIAYFY